jgi:hypothetical protein
MPVSVYAQGQAGLYLILKLGIDKYLANSTSNPFYVNCNAGLFGYLDKKRWMPFSIHLF